MTTHQTQDQQPAAPDAAAIYDAIRAERARQDTKWGPPTARTHGGAVWLTVLTEEVGEAARALLNLRVSNTAQHITPTVRVQNLRAELVQVAAVAVAWLEALDAGGWQMDVGAALVGETEASND